MDINEEYELIELNLPEHTLLKLFMMAHEEDITFNEFIVKIIKKRIEEEEKEKGESDGE